MFSRLRRYDIGAPMILRRRGGYYTETKKKTQKEIPTSSAPCELFVGSSWALGPPL